MRAFAFTIAALAWALGFAALVGIGNPWPEPANALIPALVCLVVWALLRRYCTRGSRAAYAAAGVLAALSGVFCVVAMLSVGPLLAPVAILLIMAFAATRPPSVLGAADAA